jgi:hypothetical protein
MPFEGRVHEEVPRGEAEDDDVAPCPPEMIATYFEGDGEESRGREAGGS